MCPYIHIRHTYAYFIIGFFFVFKRKAKFYLSSLYMSLAHVATYSEKLWPFKIISRMPMVINKQRWL